MPSPSSIRVCVVLCCRRLGPSTTRPIQPTQARSRSPGPGFLRRLRAGYSSVWSFPLAVHAMMQAANKAAAAAGLFRVFTKPRSSTSNVHRDPALATLGSNTFCLAVGNPLPSRAHTHHVGFPVHHVNSPLPPMIPGALQ